MQERGGKLYVTLRWQGPRLFSAPRVESLLAALPGYNGVYLLVSRKVLYSYPRGRSSLAYVGSGRVRDRVVHHGTVNERVAELLAEESTLHLYGAQVGYGLHACVEQLLFEQFEERHGAKPLLNIRRPPCAAPYNHIRVAHENLRFPYDLSRTGP